MPFPKNLVADNGMQRPIAQGDVVPCMDRLPTVNTTVTTYAVPIAEFLTTIRNRSAATVCNDVLPDAAALISNTGPLQNGMSWRQKVRNAGAAAITHTVTANTGVTVTEGVVNATSVKELLVTITNGTPQATIVNVSSTNANADITGLSQAQTDLLSVGMVQVSAVSGQQGNTIIGITPGSKITMSGNSNATASGLTFVFYPTYKVEGLGQGLL